MVLTVVDWKLEELVKEGVFSAPGIDLLNPDNDFIQSSTIEVPLGEKAYMINNVVLPHKKTVDSFIENIAKDEIDLTSGGKLYKGHTYLIPVLNYKLPKHLKARFSPKSSIGRIDLEVKAICDYHGLTDGIQAGYEGKVWVQVTPQSFNVKLYSGMALNQLRLLDKKYGTQFNALEDETLVRNSKGEKIESLLHGENMLVLGLAANNEAPWGYVAKETPEFIDLKEVGKHHWYDFFEKIIPNKEGIMIFERDKFYIMSTKEKISVPAELSGEMIAWSEEIGNLKVHYAGFFDPNFGGNTGASGVLEIRNLGQKSIHIGDGHPICKMEFFRNSDRPKKLYGDDGKNAYQGQVGPKLSKFFTDPAKDKKPTS